MKTTKVILAVVAGLFYALSLANSFFVYLVLRCALGLFVSLTPTVGFQMVLVVVIGTLIRANRIVAVILCWISNPVTFLPMYYGYYYLGAKILDLDLWTFGNFSRKLQEFSAATRDLGYLETVRMFHRDARAAGFEL